MATPAAAIAQAVEQVAVEAAEDVAKGILKDSNKDLKTLGNSVAKEAVHASEKDNSSAFVSKVEGAAQIVANEVVKGAQNVVTAVEQHPELLAEGGLAIAVGAISLVQPEFLAGEVAIIGKMAGDSATKTLTQIAQDEGTKIVQAISKDASEDAKKVEEADKKVEDDSKKIEGAVDKDVKVDDTAPAVIDPAHDGLSAAGATALGAAIADKVSPNQTGDKVVTLELDQPDTADATVHHPITLKITVGADGQVKGVAQTVVDEVKAEDLPQADGENKDVPARPKVDESKSVDTLVTKQDNKEETSVPTKDMTPEAKAEESKTEEATLEIPNSNGEEKPVSLNVTIAADGHIEAVTETVAPASEPMVSEATKPLESKAEEPKIEEAKNTNFEQSKVENTHPPVHLETAIAQPAKETPKDIKSAVKETETKPVEENPVPSEPASETVVPVHEGSAGHMAIIHAEGSSAASQSTPVLPETHNTEVPGLAPTSPKVHESEPLHEQLAPKAETPVLAAASSLIDVGAVAEMESAKSIHVEESNHENQVPAAREAEVPSIEEQSTASTEELKVSESEPVKESAPLLETPVQIENNSQASTEAEAVIPEEHSTPASAEKPISEARPVDAIVEENPIHGDKDTSLAVQPDISAVGEQSSHTEEGSVPEPLKEHVESETTPISIAHVEQDSIPAETTSHIEPVEQEDTSALVELKEPAEPEAGAIQEESQSKPEVSLDKIEETHDTPAPLHEQESIPKEIEPVVPTSEEESHPKAEHPGEKVDALPVIEQEDQFKELETPLAKEQHTIKDSEPEVQLPEEQIKDSLAAENEEALAPVDEPSILAEEKLEDVPVIEKEEGKLSSEEPLAPVTESESPRDKLEGSPDIEKAPDAATGEEKHTSIPEVTQVEEVIPKIQDDAPATSGDVDSESIEKAVQPVESTSNDQKSMTQDTKDIIKESASIAIIAAAEISSHESKDEDPVHESASHVEGELPVSHAEQATIEVSKTESSPVEREVIHQEVEISIPNSEEASSHSEDSKAQEPTHSTDVSEVETAVHEDPEVPESTVELSALAPESVSEEKPLEAELESTAPVQPTHVEGEASAMSEPEPTPEVAITPPTPIEASLVAKQEVEPSPVIKESEPEGESVETESAPIEQALTPIVSASEEETKQTTSEPAIETVKAESALGPVVLEAEEHPEQILPESVSESSKIEPSPSAPVVEEQILPKSEEQPQELSQEPVVENAQVKSSSVEAPAHVVPEAIVPVVQEEPTEVLPEPAIASTVEKPKEQTSKDIPLPFTVEHVSQPVTPSKQKTEELKADDPHPSTSTPLQATEIVAPAVISATVLAAAGVEKAVSSLPEPTPAPVIPTLPSQESLDHIHTKIDNINETLQQLTRTLSQTSAHPAQPAVESVESKLEPAVVTKPLEPVSAPAVEPVKALEPVAVKGPELISTKSADPIIPHSAEPIVPKAPETKPTNETQRPMTVTIKSVENVKPSAPAPKVVDKPVAEAPSPIDTAIKPVETVAPTTPTSTKTPTPAKRSSVWRYLWPFGGSSSKSAESSKSDKTADSPKSPVSPDASSIPQMAA